MAGCPLVRRGKVDVIVTFKLDLLARSFVHMAQIIADFQVHRVALVVPSQGIDTSNANPVAMLQINVLAEEAQFEREIITERVNAGIAAAKARGVRLGPLLKAQKHAPLVAALVAAGPSSCRDWATPWTSLFERYGVGPGVSVGSIVCKGHVNRM